MLIGTSACENEPLEGEFGDGSVPGANANFQVDIDGETFTADQANAQTANGTTMIAGATNSGEVVQLVFSGSGTGTFSLVGTGIASYSIATDMNIYSTGFEGTTGEVTITGYDLENGLISGTFSFTASRYVDPEDESAGMETLEFTNGTFSNVPLQSDAQPPQNPGSQGDFEVELDGELFTGMNIEANLNEDGLLVSATNGVQEIGFQIYNPSVGSFNLGNEESGAFVLYDSDNTDDESPTYFSTEGTLNITAYDETAGTVSGDFAGVLTELFGATENIQMTNGIFQNISFTTNTSLNNATALIDGESFTANTFPVAFVGGTVQVEFGNDFNQIIHLNFPSGVSGGTYPIASTPNAYSASYREEVAGEEITYNSIPGTGEIVITSIANNILEGTFHFDAEDDAGNTVSITQGVFTIDIN